MRIQVTRSGGVAGISRTGAVEFQLRAGSEGPDAEWAALYRAARDESERLGRDSGAGLDAASHARAPFQWTLRLGSYRVEVPDRYLSGALRELAERVLAEGQG